MRCRVRISLRLTLLALTLVSPGCTEKVFQAASLSSSTPASEITPVTAPGPQTYRETGIASWYGKNFHGLKTASGEVFDMHGMSAAHRTLPLGAIVRVTNLDNFKSIKLKVNDRGPFTGNRIIELSYGAARELAFAAQGTAPVKIEAVEPPSENPAYTVQAAVFAEEESAQLLKDRLAARFGHINVVPVESAQGRFYRVLVGSYGSEEKAELVAGRLKREGLEPFVMRKD